MHGAAALALPRAHGLALVRNTDGVGRHVCLADRFARRLDGHAEDLLGVVLDFSRRREMLSELTIAAAKHAAFAAHDERGGACGSLIEREDSGHRSGSPENGG